MGFLALALILFIFGLLILSGPLRRKKAVKKTVDAEEKIAAMKEKILVVTSSDIPTRKIRDVLGSVTGISTSASTEEEFTRAEREAMADIMRRGLEMGANAIVDLRMTTGSYEQQGAKWMVTRVVYNGTAVKI